MDLFSELQTTVQSDLNITDDSTLFPLATVKLAINRAYTKCSALFRWPELEDAKKTSTEINQEYYEYPTNWRPDSIWRVAVGEERYGQDPDGSPMAYKDYMNWKEDNSASTSKKWANQWRRFFIWPIPTANGDNNICVFGQRIPDALSADADVTIWSYSMPECNEAVVLEATAILRYKGEEQKAGAFFSTEAKGILIVSWGKIKQEQMKYEKVHPFLNVPDYYATETGTDSDEIGSF